LGGNSRTLIILCINPSSSQIEQSLSTMRFGFQAKKIENRVQANVITTLNENETIKLLIEDYEKKLKELVKERIEDKEKISNFNVEFKGKTDYYKDFIKNEENCEVLEKIGLIFMPKTIKAKQNEINDLSKKLRENWQEIIYDFEGKIPLEGYKKLKELQGLFISNQKQFKENFEEILKEFLELYEKFLMIEQKKILYKSKAKGLFHELNLAKKEKFLIKTRLNLLENFNGIEKLTNKEVLSLEEHFSKGLVYCQNERLNRVTRKTEKNQMNYEGKKEKNQVNLEGKMEKNQKNNEGKKPKNQMNWEEESPRKDNRPIKIDEEFGEFSEESECFEEIEKKLENQEENQKKKIKNEKNRIEAVFMKKIEKISNNITVKHEDLKKFELIYLDLLMKRSKEEKLDFIVKNELLVKTKENRSSFIKTNEKSNKTKVKTEKLKKPLEISPKKHRFRSLNERDFEELKVFYPKKPRITHEKPKNHKDFIEINKKSLTIHPEFKAQKALDRGNNFLKEGKIESKIEVKSSQLLPKTPVFEQSLKNRIFQKDFSSEEKVKNLIKEPKNMIIPLKDPENFSIEAEGKILMNNPKNSLMALFSNLNNDKKAEISKEIGFNKSNISESCALKISNYKSILDKETLRIIEEKKGKFMKKLPSEPNESGIEKNMETESFFSNCVNGFEYLLIGDLNNEKINGKYEEIGYEENSIMSDKKKEIGSVLKKKKK